MEAIIDGDIKAANKFSTQPSHEMNKFVMAKVSSNADAKAALKKAEIEKVEIEVDTAKVYFKGQHSPTKLKKEDGVWKVDLEGARK